MEINDSIASILQHKASATVQAVPPDAFVYDAIKLMSDRNIGCVLVMDGDSLLGVSYSEPCVDLLARSHKGVGA